MRWSWKLWHDADIVMQVKRTTDEDTSNEEKIRTTLVLQKTRWYNCAVKSIYFYKWRYVDKVPDDFVQQPTKANISTAIDN